MKSADVWKMWFIKWTVKVNGCSFQQVLRQNLGWFYFKANIKSIDSSKKTVPGIFKRALRLRDRRVFMWQSLKIEKHFQYFNFETDFQENENHFQKTGVPFFSWKH